MILLFALAWILGLPAYAQEFRRITLSDGRVLVAQVEETTADGLVLRLPQGRTQVGFTEVLSLDLIDRATWESQAPWSVLILPFRGEQPSGEARVAEETTAAVLSRLPAVKVVRAGAYGALTPEQKEAFDRCGADLACVSAAARSAGFTLVLTGQVSPGQGQNASVTLALFGNYALAPNTLGQTEVRYSGSAPSRPRDILIAALGTVKVTADPATLNSMPEVLTDIRVAEPTTPVAEVPVTPPVTPPVVADAPRAVTEEKLRLLAFVPLPGTPSLVRRDWVGFAASWAMVVPTSMVLVGGTGKASFTQGQFLGLSAAGVYTSTVAANLIFGLRGDLSVAALPGGGAAVVVSGTR